MRLNREKLLKKKSLYQYIVFGLYKLRLLDILSDETFLRVYCRARLGKKINLKDPKTFNEKLQWLKLNDRKPEYSKMVDKYSAKEYVSGIIGKEYIIETYEIWDQFSEINFEKLPNKFVLKCTHDSGGLVICTDKEKLDIEKASNKINKCLKHNYYLTGREWPYKNVKPRIIAEKLMENDDIQGNANCSIRDYKFFCFNGEPKIFKVDLDRFINHRANYYDCVTNEQLPFGEAQYPPVYNYDVELPQNLEKMKELARKLSKGIPFLRVDFYEVQKKIYFGELTFYPASGFGKFTDEVWDEKMGEWLTI